MLTSEEVDGTPRLATTQETSIEASKVSHTTVNSPTPAMALCRGYATVGAGKFPAPQEADQQGSVAS